MNKTRRKRIPRRKSYRGGNSLDECPICYEPLQRKDSDYKQQIFNTKCGHMFHVGCLYPICIARTSNCPMCRKNLAIKEKETNSDCEKIYLHMILANNKLTDFGILRAMKDNIRKDFQLDNASKKELLLVEKVGEIDFQWFDPNSYWGSQKWTMFQDLILTKMTFFQKKYSEKSPSNKTSSK
jgi:uncharacterized protein YbaR (Trm112 family)